MTETTIEGLAELDRMLKELPAKLEGTVVRGGLRAGATVLQKAARELAPVRTGKLRESIKVSTGIRNGRVYARVRAGGKDAYYAHMVEFGTAAHVIQGKRGGWLNIGGRWALKVNHPGAMMKPFMRTAVDGFQGDAVDAMAAYLRERTPREIAKIKSGL
jgi:HK97 gp10 family phage protein